MTRLICSAVTPPVSRRVRTSPEPSWVVVVNPSFRTTRYCFSASSRNSESRVAFPTQTGSTPVARGSSVPPCPTLVSFKSRRTLATTSCEVQSAGLLIFKNPSFMSNDPARLRLHLFVGLLPPPGPERFLDRLVRLPQDPILDLL